MKNMQKGSALIVIIVIVAVAIIGVLGYVVWASALAPKTTPDQTSQTPKPTPSEETPVEVDENKGYLVLEDWGVKFELPDGLSSVKFFKNATTANSKDSDAYELTTERVEALGGQCAGETSDGKAIRLASINRTQTRQDDLASSVATNGNNPIAGYYYYVSGGQSICADQGADIQAQDRDTIVNMLLSPIAL